MTKQIQPFGNPSIAVKASMVNEQQYVPPPVDKEKEALFIKLRVDWEIKAADILTGALAKLPPFQEVNHKILLINKEKVYNYHLPRRPDMMKEQLIKKVQQYKEAGWWEEANVLNLYVSSFSCSSQLSSGWITSLWKYCGVESCNSHVISSCHPS